MSALIQRANLSDDVREFIATAPEPNRAFAVLEAATEYGAAHAEPMTLTAALQASGETSKE